MEKIEQFFISKGRGNGMFTLRERGHYNYSTGEERSLYVCTLGRDPQRAFDKATAYVKDQGLDPKTELCGDVAGMKASGLTEWGECDPARQDKIRLVREGRMPYGKYYGEPISNVPVSYLADFILAHNLDEERKDIVLEAIRIYVLNNSYCRFGFRQYVDKCKAEIAARDAELQARRDASKHVGEVGDRILVEGTLTFVRGFDGFYGTIYVNVITDASGNVFVYRGNLLGDKGDVISLKATVKEHGEYNDVNQTVINRPKVQEV